MSDLVLSLIDERIQKLAQEEGNIAIERAQLQREREKLMRIQKGLQKVNLDAPKTSKPKATARKTGGSSVKEQLLAHLRAGGAWSISQLAETLGAKKTTLNGTLHQLKKAGQVMNIGNGWEISMSAANHNGGTEVHA